MDHRSINGEIQKPKKENYAQTNVLLPLEVTIFSLRNQGKLHEKYWCFRGAPSYVVHLKSPLEGFFRQF